MECRGQGVVRAGIPVPRKVISQNPSNVTRQKYSSSGQILLQVTFKSFLSHFHQFSFVSWKKTRTRTSLMDRQARKLVSVREDGGYGEENFPEAASDEEDKEVNINTFVIG